MTLDYAKGFAMLSIIIGHLYFYCNRYQGSLGYMMCDSIQIPVFMYISGLLAHLSIDRYGFRKLIVSRTIRLLFPFFSFCLIWCVIQPEKAYVFLTNEFKRGYWFLLVLFEMMVVLSFARRIHIKYGLSSYFTNGAVYVLVSLYLWLVPQHNAFNTLFSINLFWHYYFFFMLGYYSWNVQRFLKMKYALVYLLLFIVSFYCYYVYNFRICVSLCNVFSLFFLMTVFQHGYMPAKKMFSPIGVFSLQIYMINFFLIRPLAPYLPVVENGWLEFFFYLVVALVVIYLSMGISWLLMKSSWLAMFLFGIRRRKQTAD